MRNIETGRGIIISCENTPTEFLNFFKGKTQFLLLCNPPKLGASKVCITFPKITQKILTKYIIHWLELITEILGSLQIFNVRKTTTQFFFNISKNLQENRQKKTIFMAHFGPLKANYRLFLRLLTLHCFFLTLITDFYMFNVVYPYLLLLFSHLVFLFSSFFLILLTTRHILQFIMFDTISLQPARNITEIKSTS